MRLCRIFRRSDQTYDLSFDSSHGVRDVHADIVLLALPFSVLRTIDFHHADFDARKVEAIRQLGSARNAKVQAQFKSRIWNRTGAARMSTGGSYADTGYQSTWDVTRSQPGQSGILVNYMGGSVATTLRTRSPYALLHSSPSIEMDARRFLGQAESVFPGMTGEWSRRATVSIPHLDPDLQLSYSFWKKGQYQRIAGYERVNQGAIFFAGEHCSVDFQGFMEGGASEGERAADEIIGMILP